MRRLATAAALALIFLGSARSLAVEIPIFGTVAGEYREVTVTAGETLSSIAARYGVPLSSILSENRLRPSDTLPAGKNLTVNTRRIVPELLPNGLVADIAGGLLYRFEGGDLAQRILAGFGSASHPTPEGAFTILAVEKSGLDYPENEAEEARAEAFTIKKKTLPDEAHPLGPLYMVMTGWDFAIHGSNPKSAQKTHAGRRHIRLSHEGLFALSPKVGAGVKVISGYMQTRLALTPDGGIWLESHPDVYRRGEATIDDVVEALGERAVDLQRDKAARVLREKRGTAELVGKLAGEAETVASDFRECAEAQFRCLDCPLQGERRVTFQLTALAPIEIEGEFPIEVVNAAGNVVYAPRSAGAATAMRKGETRNFIWELTDTHGRPLPMGQYTVRALFREGGGKPASLSLPLWADR